MRIGIRRAISSSKRSHPKAFGASPLIALITLSLSWPVALEAQSCLIRDGVIPTNAGQALALADDLILAGYGHNLALFSDQPSGDPVLVSTLPLPGKIQKIAVAGRYAMITTGDQELYIVSFGKPQFMKIIKTCHFTSFVADVAIVGRYAFLALTESGLGVLDISNPEEPRLVSSLDISTWVAGIDVNGRYAALIGPDPTVWFVDVADPGLPLLVGSYPLPSRGLSISISGSIAFVKTYDAGLRLLDISTPGQPIEIGCFTEVMGWDGWGIAVEGAYAYVAGWMPYGNYGGWINGLRAIDISDPSHPTEADRTFSTMGEVDTIAVRGPLAYMTGPEGGLQKQSLQNGSLLGRAGQAWLPLNHPTSIAATDTIALIADAGHGVLVADVGPTSPLSKIGFVPFEDYIEDLEIRGSYAYAAGRSLSIFDLSDPSHPSLAGQYTDHNSFRRVEIAFPYAVLISWESFTIVDASLLPTPKLMGFFYFPSIIEDMRVAWPVAYVGTAEGFYVLDLSNTGAIRIAGFMPASEEGWFKSIAIVGRSAYCFGSWESDEWPYGASGLRLLDINDPSHPVQIGFWSGYYPALGLEVFGTQLYLRQSWGFQVFETAGPQPPRFKYSYDAPGNALTDLAVTDDAVLLIDYEEGLIKLDRSACQPQHP